MEVEKGKGGGNQGAGNVENESVISVMTVGCVHLQYNSSWKCHQLAAGQLLPGQTVQSGKAGGTDRPSQYKSHLPGHNAKLGRAL
jgi:hypothetical protein